MNKNIERYRHLNNFLKEKFGERTLKICVDGGFTCPNRDGKISTSGCIFCSERGSGDHILCLDSSDSIRKQIDNYFLSYKATRANKFIVYFQNFSNTYDSVYNLKAKYDSALIDDRIVGLAVATRPDCINEDVVRLLKSYSDRYYVFVELGLQTSNDNIGNFINRGYSSADFSNAVRLLNMYGIDVVCHIMIGLPGETVDSIKSTVDFLNMHSVQGLKIHSTYVVRNTVLADLYENGEYVPISLDYYLENLLYVLTHISPDIVIHRVSGDSPSDLLVAPEWILHKKWVLNGLDKLMRERDLYQGVYFQK